MKRVCLVSSGTGGHLLPAMVLAEHLQERGHEAVLLTAGRPVETALLSRTGFTSANLQIGGRGLTWPLRVLGATRHARRFLREQGIDLVLGTGGSTSVPVALAARSLHLPVCLLEQNATTGRCNRLLAPLARRLYLGLPQRHVGARAIVTGTPLRRGLGALDKEQARDNLGLLHDVPVVLVTGGSQGARALNEIVPSGLCGLRRPLQVLHLSGPGADDAVRQRYAEGFDHGLSAFVWPLVSGMATLYSAADLVICRGGGCTIAELMAVGRASIVIPYPHHRDRQQYWNGMVLEDAQAGVVIEQRWLTADALRDLVAGFLRRASDLETMGRHARALAPRDACGAILTDLKHVANLN